MKKLLSIATLLFILILTPSMTFAQGMMGGWTNSSSPATPDGHTAREEVKGKAIWEKLQAQELNCKNLSDDNFHALGMYFMGLMAGDSHQTMDTMMEKMMGEEGEEQIHIVMGKRLSGCDTQAQLPQNGAGFMPMMWMMGSAGSPQVGEGGNPMMGYGGWGNMMTGWGDFSILLFNLSLIVWLIVGILAAVWLFRQINKK